MSDTVFRTSSPQQEAPSMPAGPDPEPNIHGASTNFSDIEPLDVREERSGDVLLDALNISDNIKNMPKADQEKLSEVKHYVIEMLKQKGINPTVGGFKKALTQALDQFGLDSDSDPSFILDKISGVIQGYKNLSFIKDPAERRSIFMRLAKMQSSEEMDKEVYKLMEKHTVWR